MIISVGSFIAGLVLLAVGGEALVRGAVALAQRWGVSKLLIGLTIISLGTSAPEFAISGYAAWLGKTDIALGNVVGSNIFNVLFALGAAAMVARISITHRINYIDMPVMVAVSLVAYVLCFLGNLHYLAGIILLSLFIGFNIFLIFYEKQHAGKTLAPENAFCPPITKRRVLLHYAQVLVGIICLTLGSRLLVRGAVDVARFFEVSELIISMTIIAIGTSLPEAVTAIIAAIHGESDVVVGNVLGSNIANISGVLGVTALLSPHGVPVDSSVLYIDFPIMLLSSLICIPIFFTQKQVSRLEGMLLFSGYVLFIVYMIFRVI